MVDLDLHGLTVDEAVKAFVDFYNRHVKLSSPEPIRVVHGWGSSGQGGKIRLKLRELLAGATPNLDWKPGEDVEGNLGVTIVYPRRVIQPRENQLAMSILDFCSTPRTESKIAGEFRAYQAREIKEVIRSLLRRGQMKEVVKGAHTAYVRL
jgi:hypothetical protein